MSDYFATVARGLETIAAQELQKLGVRDVEPGLQGVKFTGDRTTLYRVNLWARIPFRVLMKLREFPCRTVKQLYRGVQSIDWSIYLQPDQTLAVMATGSNENLNHTHFTALQVKNAIVDQQRLQFGERSSVDTDHPDILVNVHIEDDRAIISLDSSGESLHRRGYRSGAGKAPIKETLAAALVDMTGWDGQVCFFDPLCGSGTFPIEAALKSLKIATGLERAHFAFENWPDFDPEVWQQLQGDARVQQRSSLPISILGSDHDQSVVQQAKVNARNCGVSDHVEFSQEDFPDVEAPCDEGILLCNPPYGERLGDRQQLGAFYKQMGDIFKQRFKGWNAYVLSGNTELTKCIGLRTAQRIPVFNGAIECRLLKYELY